MVYTFKLQNAVEYLLTRGPSRKAFSEDVVDDTVSTKADGGGYVMSLARTTRDIYRYTLIYGSLTDAEKAMIKAVDTACGGSEWFYWTHPLDGTIKTVRFAVRPNFKPLYVARHKLSFVLQDI